MSLHPPPPPPLHHHPLLPSSVHFRLIPLLLLFFLCLLLPPPLLAKRLRATTTPRESSQQRRMTTTTMGPPPAMVGNKMCPLNEHVVCNEMNHPAVRCVCTMFGSNSPPPEQSCSNLLNTTSSLLEATSVQLRLGPSFFPPSSSPVFPSSGNNGDDLPPPPTSNSADNYLEEKFKAQLAWHFKINQKNILFLRLRCQPDDTVIVQFVVLRRNRNEQPPFAAREDLIEADTVVRRIRWMRAEMQRAGGAAGEGGMEIMQVEKVTELVPVEVDVDNSRLITQALMVGAFMLLTSLCGCWISCRRRRPEDEGYEDVQQRDKV